MSFGKGFSPQKEFVDEAVKYAASKGVLLVHSAGNSGQNVDEEPSYPSPIYKNGERCPTWVSVGASNRKLNKELVASFSNYGRETVNIFAPGVEIVSLDSSNTYTQSSGTSIAGPIYSGVAALVWSYFPELSAQDLIQVLNETATQINKPKKVFVPGSGKKKKKAKFETLCSSNGVVNTYNAINYLLQKQNETAPTP
jgi:subtilisin family serine protease